VNKGLAICLSVFMHLYLLAAINPVITLSSPLTATSVTISWTQPEFSLPVVEYTVSLTRVTGSGQALCPSVMDNRPAVATTGNSMSFTGLEEFSTYTITVTATLDAFGVTALRTSRMEFTTLRGSLLMKL